MSSQAHPLTLPYKVCYLCQRQEMVTPVSPILQCIYMYVSRTNLNYNSRIKRLICIMHGVGWYACLGTFSFQRVYNQCLDFLNYVQCTLCEYIFYEVMAGGAEYEVLQ